MEEGREEIIKIFSKANNKEIKLIAPSLLLYELNNCFVVRHVQENRTKQALFIIEKQIKEGSLDIISPSEKILMKARELSNLDTKGQGHISSYDATFHALALLEGATFITADKKHYNKTKKLIGSVMLLEDFK